MMYSTHLIVSWMRDILLDHNHQEPFSDALILIIGRVTFIAGGYFEVMGNLINEVVDGTFDQDEVLKIPSIKDAIRETMSHIDEQVIIEHSQNIASMLSDLADEESQEPETDPEEKHEFWVGTDDENVDLQSRSCSKKGETPLKGIKYLNQKWQSGPRGHPSPDANNRFYFKEDPSTLLVYPNVPPHKSWTHFSGRWTNHPGFPGMSEKVWAFYDNPTAYKTPKIWRRMFQQLKIDRTIG